MVIQNKNFSFFKFKYTWFSERPQFSFFNVYRQAADVKNSFFIKKLPFYTKHIDLTQSIEDIKAQFAKNTKYKIRRADTKDNLETGIETNIAAAINFYNKFAASKNQATVSLQHLNFASTDNFIITKAKSPLYEEVMVMHFYVVDPLQKRVRLLFSATTTEGLEDSWKRSFLGRVNRYLHYKNILLFKARGFEIYDLGGYTVDTEDSALLGINRFKDNFGGTLVKENDYYPIWLYLLNKWRNRA